MKIYNNIENFISTNTITDKEKIRIAKSMPKSIPESFYNQPLIPIGVSKFKGDNMPPNLSCNEDFTVGNFYPIYNNDNNCEFPISDKTGEGMKMTPKTWTKIKYFD